MATITTCQGLSIIVDDDLFHSLNEYKWFVNERGYAFRATGVKKRQSLRMHRNIVGLPIGDPREVDHINGNKLDNRRANLRVVTRAQNCQWKGLQRNNKSGVKGVYRKGNGWAARIGYRNREIHLGQFETLELAAEFRQLAADMLYGEFANHGNDHECGVGR